MALPLAEAFTARSLGVMWNNYQKTLGTAPYLGRQKFGTRKQDSLDLRFIKGKNGLPVSLKASNFVLWINNMRFYIHVGCTVYPGTIFCTFFSVFAYIAFGIFLFIFSRPVFLKILALAVKRCIIPFLAIINRIFFSYFLIKNKIFITIFAN